MSKDGLVRAVAVSALGMLCEAPGYRTFRAAVGDLPEVADLQGQVVAYADEPTSEFQRQMRREAEVLTEHAASCHRSKMVEMMSYIPEGKSALDPEVFDKIPRHLRPGKAFANSYARIWWDRPTPTITRSSGTPSSANCIHPTQPRALSIREAARCQTFPDTYEFVGKQSEKRLQIGNAVPPLMAEALGRALIKVLGKSSERSSLPS
jgi:DNA (cytosine-5)-methyltransferase 1